VAEYDRSGRDTDGKRSGRAPKGGRVGGLLGSAGAAVALSVLIVFAPTVSARAPAASTFTSPFGGVLYDASSTGTSGCGMATIVKAPTFNLSTGVGKGVVNSSTANCATDLNGNDGDSSEQIGLASANFTTTTGLHKLAAKWSLRYTFSEKIVVPTGQGTAEAIASVSVSLLIWDSTNFTVVNSTSYFQDRFGFGNTSFSTPSNTTRTISMTAHLVSGHVYYIWAYAYISAYTTVSSSPGATATAKADLGTGKNQVMLLSYSFT
jgi:hypothetical protein